jgi:hypothetical protein
MGVRKLETLGTAGIVAAPLLFVELARSGFHPEGTDFAGALLQVLYLGGWLCGLVGLRLLRVAGDSIESRTLFVVQVALLGIALLWTGQYLFLADPEQNALWTVGDFAWPLSHLLMLGLGAQVIRAGRLIGWRRFAPLLPGLGLLLVPATLVFGAPQWLAGTLFGAFTTIGFGAVGWIVRSGAPAVAAAPAGLRAAAGRAV